MMTLIRDIKNHTEIRTFFTYYTEDYTDLECKNIKSVSVTCSEIMQPRNGHCLWLKQNRKIAR